ncbi:hypothetical protein [Ochrovirga pacifica]|uniref:hypothetical protein n=1 Tax=Ochrovirga pacifica TaxID=1042376 RepID=UPI000255778B|nr:hypothetical protein [Ochrovirga pacifica]
MKTYNLILFSFFTLLFTQTNAQETTSKLENFIQKKRNYNKNTKSGYSVILYSGDEEKARELFAKFKEEFQDIDIKLSYTSPDWKVATKVFPSKIESERVLLLIKEKFPFAKLL